MIPASDLEGFGPLLHGTARAWRLKLDERLKPMGLSQAKWRTLLHLSLAGKSVTQAEIAGRLGIEEPTLVTLLNRLENDGWLKRESASHDRRCKTVKLRPRARRIIGAITETAHQLRSDLLADIPKRELAACMRVLQRIRERAETANDENRNGRRRVEANGVSK
jgi:MarR family transcriptional regulator for hemolysin